MLSVALAAYVGFWTGVVATLWWLDEYEAAKQPEPTDADPLVLRQADDIARRTANA